jgi:hypothetical protein
MMRRYRRASKGTWLAPLAVSLVCVLVGAGPAYAKSPAWALEALSQPTNLTQAENSSGANEYLIRLTNRGAASTDGTPVTIVDHLPPGFTVNPAGAEGQGVAGQVGSTGESGELTCGTSLPVTCVFTGSLEPEGYVIINVGVTVPAGPPTHVVNTVTVTGGGAAKASVSSTSSINGGSAEFGIQAFDAWATDEDGLPDTQAGSHPYEASTSFDFNTVTHYNAETEQFGWAPAGSRGGDVRDVRVDLPPGLIGDPNAVPQCTQQQFHSHPPGGAFFGLTDCPDDTAIGVARLSFRARPQRPRPVWNLVPPPGMAASFGFSVLSVPIVLNASVRTGGDYGVQIDSPDISQVPALTGSYFTFWGVPGEASHDEWRGKCTGVHQPGGCPSGLPLPLKPFLTLPTSCLGPLTTSLSVDPWASPGVWTSASSVSHDDSGKPVGLDGCGRVDFDPQISVAPDGVAGSTPSGLTVQVHVPQERILVASSLAEANVRNTTVALPAGVALNPAAADGLLACSTGEIGFEGVEQSSQTLQFSAGEAACPDAAKVGTVEIETPLLANKLTGAAYLAAQDENPFGSLVALYIVVKDPVSGVLVKLAGQVSPDPVTGQIVSTFENTPQLPFSNLRLNFFGTARAPLSTPALCGDYQTTTSIEPWTGGAPATPSSTFRISSGPGGSPCRDPLPFAPSLTAGTTSIQAGGFSPFTMTMSREDGSQNLQGIQLHMPPGLLGTLSSVKLCGEAQANAGTCGPESLIGHTTVSVGLGGDPYTVTGGEVFITGSYEGAPYGLSIVNPADAGPFHLGKVIVRARIEVDPATAALTVTTDNTGPYKIPTILDGIPLQIRHVNVSIDRPSFTFNPTNCSPLAVTGALQSSEGSTAALSVPFQATNCAVLAFKPKLTASTSGKPSRANGTSLAVKLTYPAGPYDANIAKVKVELPKKLPSRLTTLQKACTAQVFEANPASCPAASVIGHATATTPVLPVPLSGPAYFVSHGGEAFPSLIIVLQGYGVTVHLVGSTFISKQGITSSTFKTVPDVPVGTFELTLPQGPYSALAANGNLCKAKLAMPTEFVGQNGAVIHTSTKIAVNHCPKARKTAKRKSGKHTRPKRGRQRSAGGRRGR